MILHATISGSGAPLILLHGYLSDSTYWKQLIPLVVPYYQVIALDLLGFGQSPKPRNSRYTLDDHARAVAQTIIQIKPHDRVIIVGHSMGSLIACRVAQLYPRMVVRLILSNMPLYTRPEQAHMLVQAINPFYAFSLYSPAARVVWPIIRRLVPPRKFHLGPPGAFSPHHTYISRTRSLANTLEATNAITLLQHTSIPTHLIIGQYDRSVSKNNLAHVALPANLTVEYAPTGHHTPLYRPDLLAHLLVDQNDSRQIL